RAIGGFFAADVAFIDELAVDQGSRRRSHEWTSSGDPASPSDPVDPPALHAVANLLTRAGHLVARRRVGAPDDP
ncbi:MAG TPA: hypothetical protein PKE56_02315, partial [Acidimicrobiales bacterium]|nr:hypothetical protein [Acidimicrobiales bacterium]